MEINPRDEVRDLFASLSPDARPNPPAAPSGPPPSEAAACTLHSYQRQAVVWASQRERAGADAHGICGGVIAEEMGLGKTIEVLGLIVENSAATAAVPTALECFKHPLCGGQLVRAAATGRFAGAACGVQRSSLRSE